MDINVLLSILGTAITVTSLVLAIAFDKKYGKLVNYNREMAWEIYRQISISLECYQNIQKILNQNDNRELLEWVTKGEGNDQELLLNAIKMIKRFEKNFDSESIKKWTEGKLIPNESHAIAFNKYLLK
ncbi:MAG: hypothetical protein EPN94_11450 [Nitrospirae bacterium]|nr:MAG: hypothetical protein EPN94_11450 [Nitrospirota bacterium]